MDIKKDILWRVYVSFLGIMLLGLLIVGRAFYIQRFQGNYWRSMSDSLYRKYIPLAAERGTIYSEDGQMLSVSIPTFDIYIDFKAEGLREKKGKRFRENVDSFALALARYFGDKTASEYKKELVAAYNKQLRYYPLKKKLSFEEYKVFREFPLVRLGKNKSGIITEVNSKRLMPFGLLANRTIGLSREYIASDGKLKKQNVGLEKSYDSVLSGRNGQRLVRFAAGGTLIPVEGVQTDPVNGKDLFTTIDVNIQDITQMALLRMMQQCEGAYGTAIVMETATGKIRAIANLGRRSDGTYWEDDNYALRNTEPGSTIKLVTLLSVLDKGTCTIDDKVEVGSAGTALVGNKIITDAERSPKPILTVRECFAHSSNIGMSKLAFKAFSQKPYEFGEYLRKFRLDDKPQIDLTDLPKPTFVPLDQKGSAVGNMLWMSFGYGLKVSPVHILTLYNAIANNGRMMKPYLVSSIESNGIKVKEFFPTVLEENICSPEVVQAAKSALRLTVTEGTASKAFKGIDFPVAGKTGTAQVSDGPIKYSDGMYQASFVGYFPADNPQYTCIVVIRTRPNARLHHGGTLAAPVFREIATKIYAAYVNKKPPTQYKNMKDSAFYFYAGRTSDIKNILTKLNVSYTDSAHWHEWSSLYPKHNKPYLNSISEPDMVMPDVRGMGLKDALYMLERKGVKVAVKGKGKVIMQSVSPGTKLARGITVILSLS